MAGRSRQVAIVSLGWVLVVLGLAALVLPGPGLLALFAGLALLSQQYDWARRRVEPVKAAAFKGAAEGVKNWRRVLLSLLGVLALLAAGIVWGIRPPAPDWWPLRDSWWLLGGWATGATLIASGIAALVLVIYSYRRFHGAEPIPAQDVNRYDDAGGSPPGGR